MSSINLTHHFLIAMPSMADPYFSKSLTYICEHNDQGALGLVVNRPIDMTLQSLFERLSLKLKASHHLSCVHSQLDDLQGHFPSHRLPLLGNIYRTESAFPDFLQKPITADHHPR